MEQQIAELNEKLDRVLDLLERKAKKEPQETNWSIEMYTEKSVIVKFSFNENFKKSVKDLSGKWNFSKRGWMFPLSESDKVVNLLSEEYPSWRFTDER